MTESTMTELATSDITIVDLLRKHGPQSVARLAEAMDVTATAVRQRLTRLMAGGYIERTVEKSGRGRPSHRYHLTTKGRRKAGANFGDLAVALWQEIRAIDDPDVRRGLIKRLASRLADSYRDQITGRTLAEKMESLAELFSQKRIPFAVNDQGNLPILTAEACPYPELAEQDRAICSLERMMFSELLGENVRLGRCRLSGDSCCTFEPSVASRDG